LDTKSLAIELLKLLIHNHNDGDTLVKESEFRNYISETNSFGPSEDQISESVQFINSIVKTTIIREGWIPIGDILSMQYESSYISERSISDLEKIIDVLR
jgi:hypothetical protein